MGQTLKEKDEQERKMDELKDKFRHGEDLLLKGLYQEASSIEIREPSSSCLLVNSYNSDIQNTNVFQDSTL